MKEAYCYESLNQLPVHSAPSGRDVPVSVPYGLKGGGLNRWYTGNMSGWYL